MRAKKSLGQNFLTSQKFVNDIVEAGSVTKNDTVLEIGPGKGILTEALLKKGCTVVAVEKDVRLIEYLETKFATEISKKRLKIINADILTLNITKTGLKNQKYKIIANIPYYITGKLLQMVLSGDIQPSKIVLLLQKEVAERIARDKKESILSISVKVYGKPKYIETVPARYFKPVPKVSSAIVSINSISKDNFKEIDEKMFFTLVKTGFSQKRKRLIGNLKILRDKTALENVFQELKIDPNTRAEEISVEMWLKIAGKLSKLVA